MNEKELVKAISEELGHAISQDKIRIVLNATIKVANATLNNGESVKWAGFGSLVPKDVPPRRFYSPVQKDYMISDGTKRIVFVESGKRK